MAPRSLRQTLNSGLGLPPNAYIYKIISTSPRQDPLSYSKVDQLAVIASDDSLRFLDPATLNTLPDGVVKNVNDKVTCLERCNDPTSNIVATAGRDGLIIFRDKRSRQKVASIESRRPNPVPMRNGADAKAANKLISSLVCDNQRNFIATGIENPNDGPGVSPVYVWDQRHTQKPILEFVESHTDTVTDLQLHPSLPALLLSASTDGLVNIFDVSKPDEEEALYQVINHRSAVARAGFIYPSTDIYAMGTDETLSFYALQSQEEEKTEPPPKAYGDMREHLGSEYLAKLHWIGSEPYVAAGKHRYSTFVYLYDFFWVTILPGPTS